MEAGSTHRSFLKKTRIEDVNIRRSLASTFRDEDSKRLNDARPASHMCPTFGLKLPTDGGQPKFDIVGCRMLVGCFLARTEKQ